MGGEYVEGLDFLELLYLLERVELLLHAFDGHVLAVLEGQGSEHHRERTAAFLELQLVLVHAFINKI